MVSNDLKHHLHFCAPYQEPSAASEVHYAKHFAQSSSLANSFVTDNSAHIAFFASSDYRLPVKHPCMISPTNQEEHDSDDPNTNHAHHIAPDFVQGLCLEALYIHFRLKSHFSRFSHFQLSRSNSAVCNMILLPFQHLSSLRLLTRSIRAPRASIPALHAPIIAEAFSHFSRISSFQLSRSNSAVSNMILLPSHHRSSLCLLTQSVRAPRVSILALHAPLNTDEFLHYRVFIISSCLNCISLIQLDPYFIQPFRRDSGPRLTYTHSPIASDISLSFTFFTLIRVFRTLRVFAFYVDFIFTNPINPSPMSWCLSRLDTVSIRSIRDTFAPYFTLYTSLANAFTEKQPILACPEDIIIFVPKRANARASRAPYHAVEPLYKPPIASPSRALALHRQVQEYILPVTSPPSNHRI
jgi:hypothetical protein